MKFKERISNPQSIWQIIVLVFGIGVTYGTLSYRISMLEKFKEEADIVQIKTTLGKIQTDLEWLKNARIKTVEH